MNQRLCSCWTSSTVASSADTHCRACGGRLRYDGQGNRMNADGSRYYPRPPTVAGSFGWTLLWAWLPVIFVSAIVYAVGPYSAAGAGFGILVGGVPTAIFCWWLTHATRQGKL